MELRPHGGGRKKLEYNVLTRGFIGLDKVGCAEAYQNDCRFLGGDPANIKIKKMGDIFQIRSYAAHEE